MSWWWLSVYFDECFDVVNWPYFVKIVILKLYDCCWLIMIMIMLMFHDDYVGDFDNGELLATNSYMQLVTTLMVYASIEKCWCWLLTTCCWTYVLIESYVHAFMMLVSHIYPYWRRPDIYIHNWHDWMLCIHIGDDYDTNISWGEDLGVDMVPHASRRV